MVLKCINLPCSPPPTRGGKNMKECFPAVDTGERLRQTCEGGCSAKHHPTEPTLQRTPKFPHQRVRVLPWAPHNLSVLQQAPARPASATAVVILSTDHPFFWIDRAASAALTTQQTLYIWQFMIKGASWFHTYTVSFPQL